MDEKKKNDKIIEIIGVSKVYDGVTVVDDMNLSIKRGEFVTLLGPSGCGKTTLLRMLAGFTQPSEGKILLEGVDVTDIPPYKRQINTVFQKYALFPHLNVFNNVAFGLKLLKIPTDQPKKTRKYTKQEIKEKVTRALTVVGLEDYGHRDVNSLSGGQQQRVAIARAIVLEPKVLLLDEPLGALDLKMRKDMQQELKKMHKELGISFVYVTHDQEEALTMSDNIAVIKDGSLQQYNNPKKIYDEPANAFVADFIGESNILSGIMRADFLVEFLATQFKCLDKGYAKNEKVDLVVRPEDIAIFDGKNTPKDNQIAGTVLSSVFKGTFYQMEIDCGGYEFTVQSVVEFKAGASVVLGIEPNSIHIMKRVRAINEFIGQIVDESTVEFCGGYFEFVNDGSFAKGDAVRARIAFDRVELTDDEEDGIIGANVTQSLYKGKYYQVQVFTDDDMDFYVDTPYEWDTDDRVGIRINAADISLEHYEEEDEDEEG